MANGAVQAKEKGSAADTAGAGREALVSANSKKASGSTSPASGASPSKSLQQKPQQQQLHSYKPGSTPILFADDEVKRMHREIEKRERQQQTAVSTMRGASPTLKKGGVTLKGFFVRVALTYLAIAYFFVCPNDTKRERAVCRRLDSIQHQLESYEPHLRPYINAARERAQPVVRRVGQVAQPYVDVVSPYYRSTSSFVQPRLQSAARAYSKHAHPRLLSFAHGSHTAARPYLDRLTHQYHQTVTPSVEWYSEALQEWYAANAKHHVEFVHKTGRRYSASAYDAVAPVYEKGYPLARKHYFDTVLPASRKTWRTSRDTYVNQVHPRVVVAGGHAHSFYRSKVLPALTRFYSLYVAPQVEKIKAKIFDYKTLKAETEAMSHIEPVDGEPTIQKLKDFVKRTSKEQRGTPQHRAALEALQAQYEKELAAYGEQEFGFLQQRLSDLRSAQQDDVRRRFEAPLTALEEEGDKQIGKLGRYFDRAATDDKKSVEDRVEGANVVAERASKQVKTVSTKIAVEVEDYRVKAKQSEQNARDTAVKGVRDFAARAKEDLLKGWTDIEDAVPEDAKRLSQLEQDERHWVRKFQSLPLGRTHSQFDLDRKLDEIKASLTANVNTFESILNKINNKGQKELRGEWTAGSVAEGAQRVFNVASEKASAASEVISESVASLAGAAGTPSLDMQGRASSIASVVTGSLASAAGQAGDYVSSAYGAATSNAGNVYSAASSSASDVYGAATSNAGNVYAQASQSVVRAAGYEPSPTDIRQSATSLAKAAASAVTVPEVDVRGTYDSVKQAVADAADNVASSVSSASSVVSQRVAPSSAAEGVLASAKSAASAVSRGASDTFSSASSAASKQFAPSSKETPIMNRAASAASRAADSAGSLYGAASQTVIVMAGGQPSPTDAYQSVASIANEASARASSIYEEAARYVAAGASSASSVASGGSSLAAPHQAYTTSSLSYRASSVASQAGESIKSAYGAASRAVAGEPEPTNLYESASSIVKKGAESIASRRSENSASFVGQAHSATKSVRSVVGGVSNGQDATDVIVDKATSIASAVKSAIPHVEL